MWGSDYVQIFAQASFTLNKNLCFGYLNDARTIFLVQNWVKHYEYEES